MKVELWHSRKIRFVEKDGEWWAVAKDVTDALGFRDARNGTWKMPAKYKDTTKVSTLGGKQDMTILNEKGLYRLIMRSNKPEAEEFQDWVYEILRKLRQSTGLEGFEVFRMLDKEHQKEAMKKLYQGLASPVRVDFIKANTISNKAVSSKYGHPKMLKKDQMTPQMLVDREAILEDTVNLMVANDSFDMGLSVSEVVYGKYLDGQRSA